MAARTVSLMSVDLPEPETPVTQVNRPIGNATSIPLRLLPRAPRTISWRSRSAVLRFLGAVIRRDRAR